MIGRPRGTTSACLLGLAAVMTGVAVPEIARAQDAAHEDAAWATEESAADALPASSWAGVSGGWDVRVEADALFKHYTRSSDRGLWQEGIAGGFEASASLHFRGPASTQPDRSARWLEFELGAADALRYAGWRDGLGGSTTFFEDAASVVVGAHLALGRVVPEPTRALWSGVIVGVAWVPTWTFFFGGGDFAAGDRVNPAGLRATVDVGRVAQKGRMHRTMLRLSVTWLPYVNDAPSAIAAGVGVTWY